jgi:hypothetical protein
MISLSNTSEQTISAGQTLTFNTVLVKSGCAECHRRNTGSVKLCARNGMYEINFSANITAASATPIQLSLAIGGDILPETTMVYTPATANAVGNISTTDIIRNNCCDYDRITVVNNGTVDVIVSANPVLFIRRVA